MNLSGLRFTGSGKTVADEKLRKITRNSRFYALK